MCVRRQAQAGKGNAEEGDCQILRAPTAGSSEALGWYVDVANVPAALSGT